MSITAHCLVRNDENFIWYALQSVLPYVDNILVWDTGSTDKTVEIIKSVESSKIEFEEKGLVDEEHHTQLRNEMIARTQTEWFMILDGDEVWPSSQLEETIMSIKQLDQGRNCVLSKFIFCVGDIYHYSTWGRYGYDWGLEGHYTPRFFRKISGINYSGNYDQDAPVYSDGKKVVTKENCFVSENYFFHCGVLPRSLKDSEVRLGHGRRPVNTYGLAILGHGKSLPKIVSAPEVFRLIPPAGVPKIERLSTRRSLLNLIGYIQARV